MKDLIDTEATVLYLLALALHNMVDGPSAQPIADRLHLLSRYQAAWSTLNWVQLQDKINVTRENAMDLTWDLRGK